LSSGRHHPKRLGGSRLPTYFLMATRRSLTGRRRRGGSPFDLKRHIGRPRLRRIRRYRDVELGVESEGQGRVARIVVRVADADPTRACTIRRRDRHGGLGSRRSLGEPSLAKSSWLGVAEPDFAREWT